MLRTELLETADAKRGERLHILIDPIMGDPFPDLPGRKTPLTVVHEGLREAQRPYLLRTHIQGELFDQSTLLATQEATRQRDDAPGVRSVCGWWFTSASTDHLAKHLARHALLPDPNGTRLLRYWDPRVMDLLQLLLDTKQHATLTGPASLYWAGRDAHLRTLPATTNIHDAQTALQLTEEQRQFLLQAPHVNGTLDLLQDAGHDMSSIEPLRLARSIRRGGQTWRFTTAREHITYGLYCALVDDHFDQRQEVHAAMVSAAQAGHSAIYALDQFDDTYWNRPHPSSPRTPNP